ncbi:hypothetical protein PAN31117_04638 [Pandoraea anapnoica]|uniref:Uncharacterized protein n=1 Tax=Pandoraea anapnoica TaxID=2508301 RepID=A0A5E5AJI2_9BURK|nr:MULTISPECIES: hypothetical protein [Pandoraea]VVE42512.1 hypothetical protein PIN31009_04194 [Pandoraea iniqua]VVE73167.1 hypothetical protein PAN31117_04638 [Pandoraea anapnoica]
MKKRFTEEQIIGFLRVSERTRNAFGVYGLGKPPSVAGGACNVLSLAGTASNCADRCHVRQAAVTFLNLGCKGELRLQVQRNYVGLADAMKYEGHWYLVRDC